jgi:hypothetical protein
MDQFVDRFNGCAIASGHFSRPNASILGERALQKTRQFELDTDFDLMCVEPRDYACAETLCFFRAQADFDCARQVGQLGIISLFDL